mmetsp:Transcript_122219/g.351070  ORF Transcript_122219/g.351070 Transcript_122219/m.351070 type:complete len:207 (-) Transcript_122219:1444-2064(-)
MVWPVEVKDDLREVHLLVLGLAAPWQEALAEAHLAQEALLAAEDLGRVLAGVHDIHIAEAGGQLGLPVRAAEHGEALGDVDAVDPAAHEHAQAELKPQVPPVAARGVLFDACVPSLLAPQAPRCGRDVHRDEVGDRRGIMCQESAAGRDLDRRRENLVVEPRDAPHDLEDDQVPGVEALAEFVLVDEGARGLVSRHALGDPRRTLR